MNRFSVRPLWLVLMLVMPVSGMAADTPASTGSQATVPRAPAPARSSVLELLQRLDQLEKEIRQLRGQLEEMQHDMQGVKRRQRELYLDIDRRLRELERRGGTAAAPGDKSPGTTTPSSGPAATPATGNPAVSPSAAERKAYEAAFALLRQGRYEESIKAFSSFLKQYPRGGYADNAQYWLGEANYVSRRFKQALKEFDKVIKSYPGSPKVADALLKSGFTWYELKEWAKARSMLQEVIKRFPGSSAAQLATTRLQRMAREGH